MADHYVLPPSLVAITRDLGRRIDNLDRSSSFPFHTGTFSEVTASVGGLSGSISKTHGAPWTPSVVLVVPRNPTDGTFTGGVITSIDEVTFVFRCSGTGGLLADGLTVGGDYIAFP